MKQEKNIQKSIIAVEPHIMRWAYPVNPNILYRYDPTPLIEMNIAITNLPRLIEGDVVVITLHDYFGRKVYKDKGIPCYCVNVIKKLSRFKRKPLERNRVSKVPEICLKPYA